MLALATAAAANLVAPELTISEDSSRILMISPREHRVYSRWDKTNHRALSPYGRAMADAVRAHALPPLQRARVLMLGLGGGVIPGDLLCNPAAAKRIVAVDIIRQAGLEVSDHAPCILDLAD